MVIETQDRWAGWDDPVFILLPQQRPAGEGGKVVYLSCETLWKMRREGGGGGGDETLETRLLTPDYHIP